YFFSSRRRHTRSKRDWSSDVCSSDLDRRGGGDAPARGEAGRPSLPCGWFGSSARRGPAAATTQAAGQHAASSGHRDGLRSTASGDRKSTRLNSSHVSISYAVFCLKKK